LFGAKKKRVFDETVVKQSGANPTSAIYNASAVKKITTLLVAECVLKSKSFSSTFSSLYYTADIVEVVKLTPELAKWISS
jgi:hypothetical protein